MHERGALEQEHRDVGGREGRQQAVRAFLAGEGGAAMPARESE